MKNHKGPSVNSSMKKMKLKVYKTAKSNTNILKKFSTRSMKKLLKKRICLENKMKAIEKRKYQWIHYPVSFYQFNQVISIISHCFGIFSSPFSILLRNSSFPRIKAISITPGP